MSVSTTEVNFEIDKISVCMDKYVSLEDGGGEFLLTTPDNDTNTVVVFLPGISGGAMSGRFLPVAEACVEASVAIARVSIWNDAKVAGQMSLAHIHEQLAAVINHLRSVGYQRFIGIGKSFGGAVLLTYPTSEFEKLILWAPAIGGSEAVGNVSDCLDQSLETFESLLEIKIGKSDLQSKQMPILFIHGTADATIPLSNSELLCAGIPQSTLLSVAGADHSYKETEHEKAVIIASIDFLNNKN
jgi:pimeloyl-ACP methyl ester carboxylesterase